MIRDRVEIDFECGSGWDKIIEPLIDYVEKYNQKVEKEEDKIKIVQIKEKFGGLRFYTHNEPEELRELVSKAEDESYKTCELCGSTDDVGQTADGWILTCCRKCIEKIVKARKANRKWRSLKKKKVEVIKYEK